jgi:hypothetical protein
VLQIYQFGQIFFRTNVTVVSVVKLKVTKPSDSFRCSLFLGYSWGEFFTTWSCSVDNSLKFHYGGGRTSSLMVYWPVPKVSTANQEEWTWCCQIELILCTLDFTSSECFVTVCLRSSALGAQRLNCNSFYMWSVITAPSTGPFGRVLLYLWSSWITIS